MNLYPNIVFLLVGANILAALIAGIGALASVSIPNLVQSPILAGFIRGLTGKRGGAKFTASDRSEIMGAALASMIRSTTSATILVLLFYLISTR